MRHKTPNLRMRKNQKCFTAKKCQMLKCVQFAHVSYFLEFQRLFPANHQVDKNIKEFHLKGKRNQQLHVS